MDRSTFTLVQTVPLLLESIRRREPWTIGGRHGNHEGVALHTWTPRVRCEFPINRRPASGRDRDSAGSGDIRRNPVGCGKSAVADCLRRARVANLNDWASVAALDEVELSTATVSAGRGHGPAPVGPAATGLDEGTRVPPAIGRDRRLRGRERHRADRHDGRQPDRRN